MSSTRQVGGFWELRAGLGVPTWAGQMRERESQQRGKPCKWQGINDTQRGIWSVGHRTRWKKVWGHHGHVREARGSPGMVSNRDDLWVPWQMTSYLRNDDESTILFYFQFFKQCPVLGRCSERENVQAESDPSMNSLSAYLGSIYCVQPTYCPGTGKLSDIYLCGRIGTLGVWQPPGSALSLSQQ